MSTITGWEKEIAELKELYDSDKSEFVVEEIHADDSQNELVSKLNDLLGAFVNI